MNDEFAGGKCFAPGIWRELAATVERLAPGWTRDRSSIQFDALAHALACEVRKIDQRLVEAMQRRADKLDEIPREGAADARRGDEAR